jgi:4-carboxymuconolactone decarboxylase
MTAGQTSRRIPPLKPANWDAALTAAFQEHASRHPFRKGGEDGGTPPVGNLVQILAHHPGLYQAWSTFATELHLVRRLPERDKELAILRVAWRCQAPFEWGQHLKRALTFGITHDQVEQVTTGPDDPAWSDFDGQLLRAVDELHDRGTIEDDTWAALSERYDHAQLIELTIVIGFYHLMAFILNALDVPIEEGYTGLEGR